MSEVRTWLAEIGLGQYAGAFEANDVKMDLLNGVDDQMLKDIGVTSAGHPPCLISMAVPSRVADRRSRKATR